MVCFCGLGFGFSLSGLLRGGFVLSSYFSFGFGFDLVWIWIYGLTTVCLGARFLGFSRSLLFRDSWVVLARFACDWVCIATFNIFFYI